jgi:hypothetical protein
MSESEATVLIARLRRAKRRWKAIAIGLSFILAVFLVTTVLAVIVLAGWVYFPGAGFFL